MITPDCLDDVSWSGFGEIALKDSFSRPDFGSP
jgi:hypothetical protein